MLAATARWRSKIVVSVDLQQRDNQGIFMLLLLLSIHLLLLLDSLFLLSSFSSDIHIFASFVVSS
jgi:hypothetical protein